MIAAKQWVTYFLRIESRLFLHVTQRSTNTLTVVYLFTIPVCLNPRFFPSKVEQPTIQLSFGRQIDQQL